MSKLNNNVRRAEYVILDSLNSRSINKLYHVIYVSILSKVEYLHSTLSDELQLIYQLVSDFIKI